MNLLKSTFRKVFRAFIVFKSLIVIRIKYRKHFRILHATRRIALGVMEDQNNGLVWDESNHFSKVLIFFLARGIHRIQSILVLCKKGLAKDALPILRAMFEEMVDLRYMAADKTRVIDYFNYDSYIRLKMGLTILRVGGKNIDQKRVAVRNVELQTEWDKVKAKFVYKNYAGKEKVHKRWTCMSVQQVSTEVDLEEAYDYVFGYLSNYIHSNTISAGDFVQGVRNNNVVIEVGASENLVQEVLATTSAFYLDMLSIADEEYKMGLSEKIKHISEKINPDRIEYASRAE